MCGIIAYIGSRDAITDLVSGIKKLEYRGYDSFGCALKTSNGMKIFKSTKLMDQVIYQFNIDKIASKNALFHTRWATNGGISEINAHPHLDCDKKIAVIHNGIIENAESLKSFLGNHIFVSDTDTEVIPHLIEENMKGGRSFYEATMLAAQRLSGMSSFVVIHSDIDEMVAFKNGSPLILAIDESGYFISSDIPSVMNSTNKIIYLNDGDTVHMTESSFSINNIYNVRNEHTIHYVSPDLSTVHNWNYQHIMLKEIFEQLSIWKALPKSLFQNIKEVTEDLRKMERIYFIGSGSSYHVSLYGAMLLRSIGKEAFAIQPQDIPNFKHILKRKDIVIAISQSGETADMIYYLKQITEIRKIGIINVEHSNLANVVNTLIPMSVGAERAVAATKSVSNSLIIVVSLYLLLLDSPASLDMDARLLDLNKFNLVVPSIENKIREIAELLKDEQHMFITGTDKEYILAMEGALKVKEVTYIHAEALDLVSLKHGPLALVQKGTKVIVITGHDDYSRNIEELKARGAVIIGIAEEKLKNFDYYIRTVPAGVFSFAPILFILQILSYEIAVKKGINPDKPRNLAKSVTVR